MEWLFFLAGILVGVIGEWLIDLLYWRKKRVAWAEKESGLRAEVVTAQAEVEAARAESETVRVEADSLRSELAVSEDRALKLAIAAEPRDDLTVIEGIGPKIADLLDGREVRTFAVLAETSVERLRAILTEGGPGFRLADPTTWPRQARLAANKDWERLQQVKQQLAGGVRKPPPPKPVPPDDLTIIEGIGQKIAELLNQHGIFTFAQLAAAGEEQLRAILQGAGPSFRLADPHTWPQQAQLAADRDWVKFQAVNQRLTGGVRKPPPPKPAPKDDLTIIEGIGEKIAELLNQRGIFTFAQLAAATEEQLRAILQEAGPAFRMADPHSWPQQAQLAADRDWVKLQTVNQRLTGGVRRRAPAAPIEPTLAEPTPAEPTLAEPMSAGLTLAEPALIEPTPAEPAFAEPALAEPMSAGLTLAEPALAEPTPAEPTLAEPMPVEPTLAEPGPGNA